MAQILTFGEILLRLHPPGHKRLIQSDVLEAAYGGSEANVAVALANFGHNVHYVTKLPENLISYCAVSTLKKWNVDCNKIVYGGNRLGLYYLESGASVRSSSVVYDRKHSSIADAVPSDFDWECLLDGIDLFHTSGITPILGEYTGQIVLEALKTAKKKSITTSFDMNYRSKLWDKDIAEKQKMMRKLMEYVDICFGNARDAALVLGYNDRGKDFINGNYADCVSEKQMQDVRKKYNFQYLVSSLRENISASDNKYNALVVDSRGIYQGRPIMVHIVDRVGTGDAFAAGFLHGILSGKSKVDALDFAICSAAIKHTIPGDMSLSSEEEINKLLFDQKSKNGTGKIMR